MSDMESNPEYPTLPVNLFDQPVKYENLPAQSPSTPTNPFETRGLLNNGKKQIAPGGSSSADEFSFSTRADKNTPVNVKLDNIGIYTGQ
jgi:hypothetical protein